MTLTSDLFCWRAWKETRDTLQIGMDSIAAPIERAAAKLANQGSDYARLVGVDPDGRVRFTIRGFGQQTFTIDQLTEAL